MDVFGGNWQDYEEKIIKYWNLVNEEDLVLIAGDISWAMKLEEAKIDLDRIDVLNGEKIMLKGNHDYWWTSLNKINELNLKTIKFLQNNAYVYNKTKICGARGWISRDSKEFSEHDEKVFKRELARLELSLKHKVKEDYEEIIVMMHYPPFDRYNKPNEFESIFHEYGVKKVIYGHIHGDYVHEMPEGIINGVEYFCTSADKLDFIPRLIKE